MNVAAKWGLVSASILALALAGSAIGEPGRPSETRSNAANKNAPLNPAFHEALLAVAAEYQSYGRVDGTPQLAPALCTMPPPKAPQVSKSGDAKTHGQKVYYLFAKDLPAYLQLGGFNLPKLSFQNESASGQAIVKESWVPKRGPQGQELPPDVKHGLFIMLKQAASTPGTDEGWIYGTVTADGETVTSAGRVQSCMGCHIQAPHGRLFGPKTTN